MSKKITLNHFRLFSDWDVDVSGDKFYSGKPKFIIDTSTGDKYFNEDKDVIWFKCALLTLGTPLVHAVAAIVTALANLARLITFYHFWKTLDDKKDHKATYDFGTRFLDAGRDVFHVLFAPISVVLLELSAVIGLFSPRDGRKLYASTERFTYGHFVLAPCFQPEPEQHLFGGNVNYANAW